MGTQPLTWLIRHRGPVLVFIDLIAFQASIVLTYMLRFESGMFQNPLRPDLYRVAVFLTLFWFLIYSLRGMYRRQKSISRYEAIVEVSKSVLLGIALLFVISFDPSRPLGSTRVVLLTYGLLLLLFSGGGRALFRTFIRSLFQRRIGLYRSVIVGFGPQGKTLYRTLRTKPEFGLEVVGIVKVPEDDVPPDDPRVVDLDALEDLLDTPEREAPVEYVLITLDPSDRTTVMDIIDRVTRFPVRIMIVPDFFQVLTGLARSRELYGVPMLEVFPDLLGPFERMVKRGIDLLGALLVLTVGLPMMLILGLVIVLDSRGGVFYIQKRVGYRGREFSLVKFRTMIADAEKKTGPVWATRDDPRVTRVGRFLRKTRLDELPQFWNVLIGQMSLVGPRPERKVFVEEFARRVPFYTRRLNVKPGVTGWAQVRRGYDTSIEDVREKLKYDLFYIENFSLGLDIKILLNTILVMLTFRGR